MCLWLARLRMKIDIMKIYDIQKRMYAYVCIYEHVCPVHIYILAYFKDTVKFSKDPVPLKATGCWWKCRNVPVPMPRPREYTWAKAPGRHVVVFAGAMETVNFRNFFFI